MDARRKTPSVHTSYFPADLWRGRQRCLRSLLTWLPAAPTAGHLSHTVRLWDWSCPRTERVWCWKQERDAALFPPPMTSLHLTVSRCSSARSPRNMLYYADLFPGVMEHVVSWPVRRSDGQPYKPISLGFLANVWERLTEISWNQVGMGIIGKA